MELILEGSEGVPEGGVLSIKVGDTKRQAPVSRVGQPFRFTSSPADPLPMKMELLMPAAPPQAVDIDPAVDRFVVEFGGGMKVLLMQREVQELQRPLVDMGSVVESSGLMADKLQTAQKAASYLEQHDLIRIFQDILHGLLVGKPDDPHDYIEERLLRAKRLAAKNRGEELPPMSSQGSRPARAPSEAGRGGARKSVREVQRGTLDSRAKVNTLLLTLQNCHRNLPVVLPLLPLDLQGVLASDELMGESRRRFKELDTKGAGRLHPEDLLPVLVELSTANRSSIGMDQCRRFVDMFDSDNDGDLELDEFTALVQFVIVAGYLESAEGKGTIEAAKLNEAAFKDFVKMIEEDKERLWSIIPFLPDWLVDHITSAHYQDACNDSFQKLDADGNGTLEPQELFPLLQSLCEGHPVHLTPDNCRRFTALFDTYGDGVIRKDEFIEFAQFLTVMHFLTDTAEGKKIQHQAEKKQGNTIHMDGARVSECIALLKKDPGNLKKVLEVVPAVLAHKLEGKGFEAMCLGEFDRLDPEGNGVLTPDALLPAITHLGEAHPFHVSAEQYDTFYAMFDKERNGCVTKGDFVNMAKFMIVMAYLYFAEVNQDLCVADLYFGQEKLKQLLSALRLGLAQTRVLIPFLPQDLVSELDNPHFLEQCEADFIRLDKNRSGALEPKELVPVILELSEAHHYALTEEHCKHFVDLFDVERNGVITSSEYANFARFMMVMAFLETDEGQLLAFDMEVAHGTHNVDELLRILEQDRKSVRKVLPLLPKHISSELMGDAFVMSCHERFAHLAGSPKTGLHPLDLFPLVVELSSAHPYSVTEDQCRRFAKIFDSNRDGLIQADEFLDFARFLCVMGYLSSEHGRQESREALEIMADSKRVDEMLRTVREDRRLVHQVIPYLPEDLRAHLLSDRFTIECFESFDQLDTDRSSTLTASEIHPLLLSLSNTHELALDMEQCRKFAAIFDVDKSGCICRKEFVEYARFLMIMSFLESHGDEVLDLVLDAEQQQRGVPERPQAPCPDANAAAEARHADANRPDAEFYRHKSESLSVENDALKGRLANVEDIVRRMESKLDIQGQQLAEMHLRSATM